MITSTFKSIALLLFLSLYSSAFSQQENFRFKAQLEKDPYTPIASAVKNTPGLLEKLLSQRMVGVKAVTPEWIYIQASPKWIDQSQTSGLIEQFYFEFSKPFALNDTSRATHFVNQVHAGTNGLQVPYTGKDVIIGYVDQGLDYTHPDFIDENGQTRVLYYWDHSMPFNALHTPMPYGYGQAWTASEIQSGSCPSTEGSSAHGTTVAGCGSGDGSANGTNKGMAPESKIIIVETNFNLANWTLTVADACDFIFKKADQLGLPAVVNLSLGDYMGSHDGDDPASVLMEQLLDEHPGRIVVAAAGNSGSWGKYHVGNEVDIDTSFVWFRNNPASVLGPNKVYFDLWSDVSEATWSYALAANKNNGTFEERARTIFRSALATAPVIYDTLYNGGNRIATMELYPAIVGNNLHLEVYFSNVDSTDYNFSFQTKGSGHYDLWSGTTLGLNAIVSAVPSATVLPSIVHYVFPDTLQTIVSAWNCSEKVISVGNVRNRFGHVDKNGNYYQPAPSYTSVVHQLSPNSSKGPSRHGIIKPDISAAGDVSLSAAPMWFLANPANNAAIDLGGFHVRNGGTSMASPVVAGIAALYLEKCHKGTYQTFKDAMTATAFTDALTGTVPNNAYGAGKIHALNLLLLTDSAAVVGPDQYCGFGDSIVAAIPVSIDSILWNTQSNQGHFPLTAAGSYFYTAYAHDGCVAYSDTLVVSAGDIPPTPMITATGTTLSTAAFPLLQWFEDGVAISGATGTSITITLPSSSDYTVEATGTTGCVVSSAPYNPSAGLFDESLIQFSVYPNPSNSELFIQCQQQIDTKTLFDIQGKSLKSITDHDTHIDISDLSAGSYLLFITAGESCGWTKIVKN